MEEKNHRIIYILLIICFLFFLFFFLMYLNSPLEVRNVKVVFKVNDSIGVNMSGSDEVNFGSLIPGSSASRNLILENKKDFPIEVKIYVSKNIKEFLIASDTVISSKEKIKLPLNVKIPVNTAHGDYNGEIRIEFYKRQ